MHALDTHFTYFLGQHIYFFLRHHPHFLHDLTLEVRVGEVHVVEEILVTCLEIDVELDRGLQTGVGIVVDRVKAIVARARHGDFAVGRLDRIELGLEIVLSLTSAWLAAVDLGTVPRKQLEASTLQGVLLRHSKVIKLSTVHALGIKVSDDVSELFFILVQLLAARLDVRLATSVHIHLVLLLECDPLSIVAQTGGVEGASLLVLISALAINIAATCRVQSLVV